MNSMQSIEVLPPPKGETDDTGRPVSSARERRVFTALSDRPEGLVEGEVQTQASGAQFFWVKDPDGHPSSSAIADAWSSLPVAEKAAAAPGRADFAPYSAHGIRGMTGGAEDHFFTTFWDFVRAGRAV